MDYKNGKIYQILNNINDEVYVGSTIQSLSKIMYDHRMHSKYQHCNFYKLMKEIGPDSFYIELIESYPCNNKEELNAREGYFIRERGTLNKAIIGRTPKQWVEDNKEHVKQYKHNYYKQNMEHINKKTRNTMITTKSISNKSRSNTMKPIKNIVKKLRNNIMKTIKNTPLKKSYVIYVGVKSVEVEYQDIKNQINVNHMLNLLRMRD